MSQETYYQVKIGDKDCSYPKGTTLMEIAKDVQKDYDAPIVLAIVDHKLSELFRTLEGDCRIEFETLKGHSGHKAYKRSACLLMIKAFYDVLGKDSIHFIKIEFSIGAGYFCRYEGALVLTEHILAKVKARMEEIVKEDLPIQKGSYPLEQIMRQCRESGMKDKERLFRYRRGSKVNMYTLGDYQDYYYGYMLPSAGYITVFDLFKYEDGMILQLPERKAPDVLPPFKDMPHLFRTMWSANVWGEMMRIDTVGALNDSIGEGRMNEIILVQEALQESRIAEIAKSIKEKGNRKFVMIAGPSSSGKTTFSHRLSIQLIAHGMRPHPIGVDDYFKNREDTPLDEEGNYDFESLGAIDVEGFNRDMTALLQGETVQLPRFNFKTGQREYRGDFLKLGPEDILVIEGIHGLNDKLSYSLPPESKFRIYISALTTLNVDEHNRVPTTDARLIRRMVRDYRTRGASASRTMNMWDSVRRGEEQNIFPFQESADAMFNSALVYELAVLKPLVEPLLFGIPKEDPCYQEAKRLLKFLEYFLSIDTEHIPKNSIVREFVGGSCFDV
ncbi:MAG: nucleoside kinase [Lachnospiraceae bacterium]|nr:nucleoside kinase [Lachnospiraceae bacterium]